MRNVIAAGLLSLLCASCAPSLEEKNHVTITKEDFNEKADKFYRDGLFFYKKGANKLASDCFDESLKYDLNHPGSNHFAGEYLLTKGDYKGAEELVRRAIMNESDEGNVILYRSTLRLIIEKRNKFDRKRLESTF